MSGRRGSLSKPSKSGRVMAWVVLVVVGMVAGWVGGMIWTLVFWSSAMAAVRAKSWKVGHLVKAVPESAGLAFVAVLVVVVVGS